VDGLHIVPVLLGDGARLFDNIGGAGIELEQVRAVEAPGVTHLKYRVASSRREHVEKPGGAPGR
jgi:hypothetical protein